MPIPKLWFLGIFNDHIIRILHSHRDQIPEAKCPGPTGKPRRAIPAISSQRDLPKAGTPSNVRLRLISVSCQSMGTLQLYGVCM